MKFRPLAATALLLAATLVGAAPATGAVASATLTPSATVHPSAGLSTSSIVTVKGTGLPAHLDVDIVQCDVATYDSGDGPVGCPPVAMVTTSASGTLSVQLNPRDPVYRTEEFGDPIPVYCRADGCHYFIEWTDADGLHSVATPAMFFHGSPATIAATPKTGLTDGQRVKVTGTAHGSAGRYVTIEEVSCFSIVQGHGCDGALPLATVRLSTAGTFAVTVATYRYLGDGEDCFDNFYGCELVAIVLNADGQPDDSFGVSGYGQPGVTIDFIGP